MAMWFRRPIIELSKRPQRLDADDVARPSTASAEVRAHDAPHATGGPPPRSARHRRARRRLRSASISLAGPPRWRSVSAPSSSSMPRSDDCGGATALPFPSITRVAAAAPFHRSLRRSRQRGAVDRHHAVAVAGQPAGRHVVDDLGRTGRQADQGAVGRHDRLRHLAGAREGRMLDHVADLAMDRQGDLRSHPLIDPHQLVARRMARDVDIGLAVGDDLDAARPSARCAAVPPSVRCRG